MKRNIQSQILNDPYYRFQSIAEVQLAAKLGVRIDANRAGVDDWLRLPGLSIHQARSLVALAQSGVQFHCVEDLAAALSLPVERLQPLLPVLQFCYYDSNSPIEIQPLNPNVASVEALSRIPAIDLFLARAIVEERQHRAYLNLVDLQQRLTLPGKAIAELMHYFRF
ncbi:ComEA family DNA-binding protein [Phormidium tenue FACHB-886]|nr:ComEA family DNA-binding protein [Phormidium tenue FACHB-886]